MRTITNPAGSQARTAGGDRFTRISSALFRDPGLSFKAKGIFGLISTHRDGHGITISSISAAGKDGPDAVRSALRELEEHGYLERRKKRDGRGRLVTSVYLIRQEADL